MSVRKESLEKVIQSEACAASRVIFRFCEKVTGNHKLALDLQPHGPDEERCYKAFVGKRWSEVPLEQFLFCREYFQSWADEDGQVLITACVKHHLPGYLLAIIALIELGDTDMAEGVALAIDGVVFRDDFWTNRGDEESKVLMAVLVFCHAYFSYRTLEEAEVESLFNRVTRLVGE